MPIYKYILATSFRLFVMDYKNKSVPINYPYLTCINTHPITIQCHKYSIFTRVNTYRFRLTDIDCN